MPACISSVAGDTLFVLGCGRLFEGSPQQMWASLSKMLPLPPSTRVFCAHEYTQSNARFALHANPDSSAVQQRKQEIDEMRAEVCVWGVGMVPCHGQGDGCSAVTVRAFKNSVYLLRDAGSCRGIKLGVTWQICGPLHTLAAGAQQQLHILLVCMLI